MKNAMKKILLCSILFVWAHYSISQLTTVKIPISYESYVSYENETTNYGSDTIMKVGTYTASGNGYFDRSFLKFDLDTIPVGAEVYTAKIVAFHYNGEAGSNPLLIKRLKSLWHEDSITFQNQPTISTDAGDISSTYTVYTDSAVMNVSYMTKWMHYGLLSNYGWDIEVEDETDTSTTGIEFYTREASNSSKHPYLLVQYYFPIQAENVSITHESTTVADDGIIDLDLVNGSESYSWEWIDGFTGDVISTDTILDSLSYGWYGLHATGTYGEEFYQAFIVGLACDTVDITFRTWPEYTNSAYISNVNSAGVDQADVNFGGSSNFIAQFRFVNGAWRKMMGLMKFHLYIDSNTTIEQADLTMYGKAHEISNWRTNEADFIQITENWHQDAVTYNNQPDTSGAIMVFVDSVSTTTQNRTMDVIDFFDFWRDNPDSNFGMYFRLQDFTTQFNVKQHYHSADATDTTKHPIVEFSFYVNYPDYPLICNPGLLSYKNLKREIDGSYAATREGIIRFAYLEEYQVDTSEYLTVNLYDDEHDLIASCDRTGTTSGGMTAIKYNFDDNRYLFDVSGITGITEDEYYILEVTNTKGDRRYIRFLYQN